MKRRYRQTERAQQTEATRLRIMAATNDLFVEHGYADLTLAAVARAAGVTTQTVLRHFGDKEGLVAATGAWGAQQVRDQRDIASPGDVPGAVANLVTHYERTATVALRLLADSAQSAEIARFAEMGKAYHREWCARVFAPYLSGLDRTVRRRRLAQFVAICDVRTWQLLRHDAGLSRAQTSAALVEMLVPLTDRSS